jgi:transcription elongation factor GreA
MGTAVDEVVLTPEGFAKLDAELRQLTEVRRPAVAARLAEALQFAGDLTDNAEYLDAQAELDRLEQRIARLDERVGAARVLRDDEPSAQVVSLGSRVLLDDLDDGTHEEYVLVSSAESNPSGGRISTESPVGRALEGHRRGDLVEAHAPHGIRHLRITEIHAGWKTP